MGDRYVPLFWRLLMPNVTVLATACVVLIVEPANGRIPALVGGLLIMVAVNAVAVRRAITPLARLTWLMQHVDPMRPGQRLPLPAAHSEVAVLAEAFNDMLDRLETERREAGSRALSEREGERRRVAGELHDQIGQSLTALGLHLDRVLAQSPDELRAELTEIRDGQLASVEDVRRLARELRPEALDALGLVPALTNLSERLTRHTGIEIRRGLDRELPRIGEDAEVVVFRIAQESLTNAVRHGAPGIIELDLRCTASGVALRVTDDGRGLPADGVAESGIRAMRERALSIGAELRVGPRAGGPGTQVELEVPAWKA